MQYPIVTICGSMRYYNHMLMVANEMTQRGYIVLMPFVLKVDDPGMDEQLQALHRAKIDLSEYVLVVGSAAGESTRQEIAYAEAHGKIVIQMPKEEHSWLPSSA